MPCDQPINAGQQQSSRRYLSAGSSPAALTPRFTSLSMRYPLSGSPHSAGSSSCTSLDDAVGRLFTRYLPTFFDLLEKFQFHKALLILEDEEEMQWKGWDAVKVMIKLGASCESTYHSMKYLEAELVQTLTIEEMYGKLIVLMKYLADELKPIVTRHCHQSAVYSPTFESNKNAIHGSRDERDGETEAMQTMEMAACGEMRYYVELLEQGAEFFSLRVPMIEIYRGLALASIPRDYHSMLKQLKAMLLRYDLLNHPLLETMKQSTIEELSTVRAALQCEIRVAEYDFTRSIVALHRLKAKLRSWSDHIDAGSDYPLFEGNGIDYAAGDEEGDVLLGESDEKDGIISDSMYSNTSCQSSSSLVRDHFLNSNVSCESRGVSGGNQGGQCAKAEDFSNDHADEKILLERNHSGFSLASSFSPASSETHSTFRRLFSHSNLLRRGSGLASALPSYRGLVQKPGDPYVNTEGANSSMPNNTLEQAILGGGGNSTGCSRGSAGTSLETQDSGGGMVLGSTNLVAAEMMASSMKKQERDDGFALPVFQWSKRFYRSLVAKFTLYFHRWLEPFEKKTNLFTLELTRFIKTPLGISYLGLMDVLLSRAYQKDGCTTRIMLILETQALESKGAHYYENGYRCPSSSNALHSRTGQDKQGEMEEQETVTFAGSAKKSGNNSRIHSPASSRGKTVSPGNGHRRSIDQEANHALFMQIDREEIEEQSDFSELWGLRSWPAVFCYPEGSSPPLDHWPNIISLIMDNRASLDSVLPVFQHSERRLKTTYYISRVDEAMYLVLLTKEVKKMNMKVTQDFMQTITENLQHLGAFAPRVPCTAVASLA